jgi:sporulation protein YlmC with PRC-barrel domain
LFSNGTIAFRGTFTSITLEEIMTRLSGPILAVTGLLTAASISALPAFAADNMQTAEELRTSQLVGAKVYNNANENIGSIEDIILKPDGSVDEVVLSVGGFLGMGDKYVAVPFSDLKITRDGSSLKIVTLATKDSLKALPAYQFFKS